MRDLIVTQNITVDGVIEATDNWFGPVAGEVDMSDVLEALTAQREAADAVVLGRITFEQFRGYWPLQENDTTGNTDYLNRVDKYVVSTALQDPEWKHSTVLRSVEDIRALKSESGADIVSTGSMRLVGALIAARLVDEYRLFIHPVVVGRGHRLFSAATTSRRLRLVETRPFRSGIVLVRYRTS